jgi:hypothetical protein
MAYIFAGRGSPAVAEWTTEYQLMYSDDGDTFYDDVIVGIYVRM